MSGLNDLESVVKEADLSTFLSGSFPPDVCEQSSHLFINRLRQLWEAVRGHSVHFGVRDTFCVSELLHVPKFYCHVGECGYLISFCLLVGVWGGSCSPVGSVCVRIYFLAGGGFSLL